MNTNTPDHQPVPNSRNTASAPEHQPVTMAADFPPAAEPFAELTRAQHQQLQLWLLQHSYDAVLALIARPAPDGFGLKTQSEMLHRYFCYDLPKHALENRRAATKTVRALAAVFSTEPAPYRTITLENLEMRLTNMSFQPLIYMDHIVTLFILLLKQDHQHLKERQLAQSQAPKIRRCAVSTPSSGQPAF